MSSVVIIGGGACAAAAVSGLREGGFAGRIVLVAAERVLPYDWLALAEDYLSNTPTTQRALHPLDEAAYTDAEVEVLLGVRAQRIDTAARAVFLDDGRSLSYDALVLANGTEPVPLGVPGAVQAREAGRLHDIDSFDGAERLRRALVRGGQVVVLGSGRAASAAAAAARHWGGHVVLLSPDAAPFSELFGPEGGEVLADLHRDNGVDVQVGTVAEFVPTGVRTAEGEVLKADVVVVALRPQPATELARAAGLEVTDGIVVNESLATSAPGVWAVGGVAAAPAGPSGTRVRVEGWSNDAEQGYAVGLVVAREAAQGQARRSSPLPPVTPYFALQPYEDQLRFWGTLAEGYDAVVFRGDGEGEDGAEELEDFCLFWCRDGHVVAAMDVNSGEPDVGRLVTSAARVETVKLSDLSTPLDSFL